MSPMWIWLFSSLVGTGMTMAKSFTLPWKSLAMARTVLSSSRTITTCDALLKSLASALATKKPQNALALVATRRTVTAARILKLRMFTHSTSLPDLLVPLFALHFGRLVGELHALPHVVN